jgi:serine/threonine-protein kinase
MSNSESLPPGSVPVAIGEILAGKYRVDRVLGVGGMGVVVAATHLQLDQRVALKFMLAPGLKSQPLVERFTREARAAVRLRSDHVARVLDVGTLDTGSPYMVMEFLEGYDLGTMLERHGPLPIDAAVDCVLQACDAVAEAHSIGIVHRDLKPRNLFLTYRNDGRPLVKVLDFGISKTKGGGDLSLTRTTEIIGSPNYMSPEQFRAARAADERSDIWALGVILYELLTGQVPFLADTVTQLTAMVLSEPPRPIQALRANVPDELVRVIERCMHKDPNQRFQSVAQLANALQRFAPPDTRELAARIARIGAGPRASSPGGMGVTPTGAMSGTPSTWSGSGSMTEPSRGKRVAFIVAAVCLVLGGAAVVGARFMGGGGGAAATTSPAKDTSTTSAPTATATPPATSLAAGPTALPLATATLAPVLTAPPPPTTPPVVTTSPPPQVHTAAPPQQHVEHVRPANEARDAGSPDEPPRYRTQW